MIDITQNVPCVAGPRREERLRRMEDIHLRVQRGEVYTLGSLALAVLGKDSYVTLQVILKDDWTTTACDK